jgi:heat shock protein HspQ
MEWQRMTEKAVTTFEVGDVVQHRRYGYRGVIVDFDTACTADEEWYQRNNTQPARNQRWYHVLVHGGVHTTYVAQENLERDTRGDPVEHPLLEQAFRAFFQGRYYKEPLN